MLLFSWMCNGLSNFLQEKKLSSFLISISHCPHTIYSFLNLFALNGSVGTVFSYLTFLCMCLKVHLLAGWLVESCLFVCICCCFLTNVNCLSSILFLLINQNIFCFSFSLDVVSALQYFLRVAVCPQGCLHHSQW